MPAGRIAAPSLSGFTIIRNAELYGYPVVESIRSILPICGEFVVNVGRSEDGTLDLVRSIPSPKLRILESEWDLSIREGGRLLSIETNRALERCSGDWCFYLQADEVLHDRYLPVVAEAVARRHADRSVEGLEFGFRHFYGSYAWYQTDRRTWYPRETRVIRRDPDTVSWGDAMGFRRRDGRRLRVRRIDAEISHYGYVRSPAAMWRKWENFERLWHSDEAVAAKRARTRLYDDVDHLERFRGTHPTVMTRRILEADWSFDPGLDRRPPRWLRRARLFLRPLTKRIRRRP